jgi:4-nitrophenyl phosphatase
LELHTVQALIVDIDGTLYLGESPLPGVAGFFAFLHREGIPVVVVSNNSTKAPVEYVARLAELGVSLAPEQVLTASEVAAAYLRHELGPGGCVYVIGECSLRKALRASGLTIQEDASQPVGAVVVGGDSTLTYDKLKHAALLLQRGSRFVGTNPDLLCPTDEGLVPEAGTILAALQAATGMMPVVIGKPERHLFDRAVEMLGSRPERTAVLGDRLETDIGGGQRAGLQTILVTTGVDDERTVAQKGIRPDLVVSGLDELVDRWSTSLAQASTVREADREGISP